MKRAPDDIVAVELDPCALSATLAIASAVWDICPCDAVMAWTCDTAADLVARASSAMASTTPIALMRDVVEPAAAMKIAPVELADVEDRLCAAVAILAMASVLLAD